MMWNYGGYSPVFSWMMVCMMVGIVVVYIIFLIAAWRLMRAHEHIAESIKEITQNHKSKSIGNQ
jgi:uncharacterized membrane protein